LITTVGAAYWYFREIQRTRPIDAAATRELKQSGKGGVTIEGWPEWYGYWRYLNLALALIVGMLFLSSW
jgi:hypothetical protein